MMLIELFVPRGVFTPKRRAAAAERLRSALTGHHDMPAAAAATTRAFCHVVVHETDTDNNGRYLARATIPGGSMMVEEGREHYIGTITRVLAETSDDPARFWREPLVSVHLVEVPPGDFGLQGRPMREADLISVIMGETPAIAATPVAPGADTAVDPVCGMTVSLAGDPITLTHDGATYGFCCAGCRDVFGERLAVR